MIKLQGFEALDSIVQVRNTKPTNMDIVLYIFWEKGIDYNKFKDLPIPYILNILKTHNWVKKEEEKAYKKAGKK